MATNYRETEMVITMINDNDLVVKRFLHALCMQIGNNVIRVASLKI